MVLPYYLFSVVISVKWIYLLILESEIHENIGYVPVPFYQ
jgi:hypothetical protein